ncbi:MAG: site-2 protease family protein [Nitrososphaeria archaeon]
MSYYYGIRPGKREVLNLLIGAIIVWIVGITWIYYFSPSGLIINSILFILAFILHEYAHKVSAIRSGLYAEFRLQWIWAILTLITAFLPFKIIAPGATVVYGFADEETMGKISAWGPITNIIMGLIVLPFSMLYGFLITAVYFNAFIALFNLLPFAILDGRKIFRWSRKIWAILFTISAAMYAMALLSVI